MNMFMLHFDCFFDRIRNYIAFFHTDNFASFFFDNQTNCFSSKSC